MKRRSIFAALATFLSVATMTANPIGRTEALQIANGFNHRAEASRMMKKMQTGNELKVVYSAQKADMTDAYYYVVSRGAGNGYIMVSGEDRLAKVLGYVDSGNFDRQNIPDNMRYWLSEFQRRIDYLDQHPEAKVRTADADAPTSVAPLLGDIKWNQSPYYNQLSPGSYPIGCVAVSLGQILYYWQWPVHGEGQHTYTSTENKLTQSADFENTYYDWENMANELNSSSPEKTVNAVATLLYNVATGVEMDYANGGSGAYSEKMAPAMANYFRYDKKIQLVKRNFYDADTWVKMLRNELDNGRPVVYDGATSTLSGHSFVCDGYNEEGYYHINWGWGGNGDGYFLLTALAYDYVDMQTGQSMKDGFNYYQDMLIGFKPDRDGTSQYREREVICEGFGPSFDVTMPKDEAISVMACEMYNTSNFALDIDDLALVVYDSENNVVATKSMYKGNTFAGQYLDTLRTAFKVPANLPVGDYEARLGYKVVGETEYSPVMMTIGTNNSIAIHVSDTDVRYATVGKSQLKVVSMTTTPEVLTSDVPSEVRVTVRNDGGKYDGMVNFRLNIVGDKLTKHWYIAPKQDVTIDAGETKEIVFKQTLELAGDDNYEITFFDRVDEVFHHNTLPLIGREKDPDLQLIREIYFTPRDWNVPINCMILNADVRNDGGAYDGQMTMRMFDNENFGCDGMDADIMNVKIAGGQTKTIRLHATYDPNKDWSMSNQRVVSIYDITSRKYLEPFEMNHHEFTYGSKDPSVVWEPEDEVATAIATVDAAADGVLTVEGDIIRLTSTEGMKNCSIYSADGRLLLRQYQGSTIDISQLRQGSYIVVLTTAEGEKTVKINR